MQRFRDCDVALSEYVREHSVVRTRAEELRKAFREACVALIFDDPQVSEELGCEVRMWKQCSHSVINDLRSRLRRLRKPRRSRDGSSSSSSKGSSARKAKAGAECAQIEEVLVNFVRASEKFYKQLLLRLRADDRAEPRTRSTHRCLLFLGDLARYRELCSGAGDARSKSPRVWADADRYYRLALAVVPSSGHPHNQLAVLASYCELNVVVVYRYIRALCAAEPFATAGGNLFSLFLKRATAPRTASSSSSTANATSEKCTDAMAPLYRDFVRYHGLLFLAHSEPPLKSAEEAPRRAAKHQQRVKQLLELHQMVCKRFAGALRARALSAATLLKLVVINVYTAAAALRPELRHVEAHGEHSAMMLPGLLSSAAVHDAQAEARATDLRAFAGAIAFAIAALLAQEVALSVEEDASGLLNSPSSDGMLPPIAIFCDWLRAHRSNRCFGESDAAAALSSSVGDTAAFHPQMLCTAARGAWTNASAKLVDTLRGVPALEAAVGVLGTPHNVALATLESKQPLKETVELRGFLPLERIAPRLQSTATPATGVQATVTRIHKVRVAVLLAVEEESGGSASERGREQSGASQQSVASQQSSGYAASTRSSGYDDEDEVDGEQILYRPRDRSADASRHAAAVAAPRRGNFGTTAAAAAAGVRADSTTTAAAPSWVQPAREEQLPQTPQGTVGRGFDGFESSPSPSLFGSALGSALWAPSGGGGMGATAAGGGGGGWGGDTAAVTATPWGFAMPGLPDPNDEVSLATTNPFL